VSTARLSQPKGYSHGFQLPGVLIAAATALTSGIAVFVNSYGVHAISNASVYTTAKNLVAFVVLAAFGMFRNVVVRPLGARPEVESPSSRGPTRGLMRLAGLTYVGVVGGGLAFVLFFDGLARTSAEPAAFLHDTIVIWVAILALLLLSEVPSVWNLGAIVFLVGGQVAVSDGVGHLVVGEGEILVLAAAVLWGVETVIAKQLLVGTAPSTLAVVRMGVGVIVLVVYVAVTGHWSSLVALDATQIGWVVLTGSLLAVYVGTWMLALSRARAVDVTSVLAFGAVVTALLQFATGKAPSVEESVGFALVAVGTVGVLKAWPRPAFS
jgi:drug/metabolite transporter (DMT)-like permease